MRRVLVLGGSGQLGRVVCAGLVASDATVALTYCGGRAVVDGLKATHPELVAIRVDLSGVDGIGAAVDEAAEALGGLDTLVHCAAIGIRPGLTPQADRHQTMAEIPAQDWDLIMNVNVRSAFLAGRRAAEIMQAQGQGGDIVLVSSIDGVKPVPSPVHYAASKAALTGMARAMAKELGADDIRVNAVAPGMMDRGLSEIAPEHLVQEYVKHSGLKRRCSPDEVASVVCWLALRNSYITGETIAVDGGL